MNIADTLGTQEQYWPLRNSQFARCRCILALYLIVVLCWTTLHRLFYALAALRRAPQAYTHLTQVLNQAPLGLLVLVEQLELVLAFLEGSPGGQLQPWRECVRAPVGVMLQATKKVPLRPVQALDLVVHLLDLRIQLQIPLALR